MKPAPESSVWGRYGHQVHLRSYGSGHRLYEQGDDFTGLYRIKSGLIGLRKVDENGATMLVGLLGPGDFVGYAPLLVQGTHLTTAEVLRPSELEFICAKTAAALAKESSSFLQTVFCQATRDLTRLENRYLQMNTEQAPRRLARLLLSLKETCDTRANEADFELPLLHKDMADLIGVRPETLSRAIAQLRSSGVANLQGRRVKLANPARLARMVGADVQLIAA